LAEIYCTSLNLSNQQHSNISLKSLKKNQTKIIYFIALNGPAQ